MKNMHIIFMKKKRESYRKCKTKSHNPYILSIVLEANMPKQY